MLSPANNNVLADTSLSFVKAKTKRRKCSIFIVGKVLLVITTLMMIFGLYYQQMIAITGTRMLNDEQNDRGFALLSPFTITQSLDSPLSSGNNKNGNDFSSIPRDILALLDNATWTYRYPEIDIVYTWVNGSDTQWFQTKEEYLTNYTGIPTSSRTKTWVDAANAGNRYRNHNELRYSFRSVAKYIPWFRKIFLVVANDNQSQTPWWLNISHPKIEVITHSQIIAPRHLPTFNSAAIEANLVNIPGLSEYFLYLNDDTFVGQAIQPQEFFLSKHNGNHKISLIDKPLKSTCETTTTCRVEDIGNGICDEACLHKACGWDHGDCGREILQRGQQQARDGYSFTKRGNPGERWTPHSGEYLTKLSHVSSIYNAEFGHPRMPGPRRPPSHAPYFFSKRILLDMEQRFQPEFEWTSSHRFRHNEDMQYTFSYIYYVDAVRVYAPSWRQIWWAALTTTAQAIAEGQRAPNRTTFLVGENRHEWEFVEGKKFRSIQQSEAYSTLLNCSVDMIATASDVTPGRLRACREAVNDLVDRHELRLPIHDLVVRDSQESKLLVLSDDQAKSLQQLASVRGMRFKVPKFVTVNDDMTQDHPQIEDAYRALLEHLFPTPCAFERTAS